MAEMWHSYLVTPHMVFVGRMIYLLAEVTEAAEPLEVMSNDLLSPYPPCPPENSRANEAKG